MNLLHTFKLIFFSLIGDRAVQTGSATSGVSLFGAATLTSPESHIDAAQQYLAFYAAVIGALTATATLVYMIIKISRLLRNKDAKE